MKDFLKPKIKGLYLQVEKRHDANILENKKAIPKSMSRLLIHVMCLL